MSRFYCALALLFAVGAASGAPFVAQYCSGCHNARMKSGNVDLSKLETDASLAERVIRQARIGRMPPPGATKPTAEVRKLFVAGLQARMDQNAALHPAPGAPPLHRLNRTEYANAVRDLLDLEIDAASQLPADDLIRGFDNLAEGLTLSPTLIESYTRAAGKISRQAVGDPEAARQQAAYTLPRVVSQTRHVEGAPFGTRGGMSVIHAFPADGDYVFHVTFYFHQMGTTLFGRTLGKGQKIEISINGERKAVLEINPAMKQFDDLKTPPIRVAAGPQRVSAAFLKSFDGPVEDLVSPFEQALADVNAANIPGLTSLPHLHDLVIDGPVVKTGMSDTPARRRIFSCRPVAGADDIPCAKQILTRIARLAYRRSIDGGDLDRLLSPYVRGRETGGFEGGIQAGLQAILSNPEFLFRFEQEPAGLSSGSNYRIRDIELASRLSFFLWSSLPDEPLLRAAESGTLRQPIVLRAQIRRMLADPRSEALSKNFASLWLNLQNLKEVLPDPLLFPNFDRNLSRSMRRETELLFASVVREDRSPLDLLTANYTYVDELLAKHYGIPNILGPRFRRVAVTNPDRQGLLGHASILTLTSVATRTAPVIRGKWVMDVLLGTPPPAPPPNVPALKEAADLTKPVSVRDRLQEHRANPACASCHAIMDPIGFSLENYNAIGLWRTRDSGFPIDSTAQLFDGTKLDGPASLRRALVSHSDAYLESFTERLLAYGVGRVPTDADMPTVRSIVRSAALRQNRFSAFVQGVVESQAFQRRTAGETKQTQSSN